MLKKFFLRLILLVPIAVLLMYFNYKIDPASIFSSDSYEESNAKLLLKGRDLNMIGNEDKRLLKKFYIEGLSKKEIIAIGSSRIDGLGGKIFKKNSFANIFVDQTILEDDSSLYFVLRKEKLKPSVIILELSPWLLNKNNGVTLWKSLGKEHEAMIALFQNKEKEEEKTNFLTTIKNFNYEKYFTLVSASYFQASFEMWFEGKEKVKEKPPQMNAEYIPLKEKNYNVGEYSKMLSDGSVIRGTKDCPLDNKPVLAAAELYATQKSLGYLSNYTELDQNLIKALKDFVGLMKRDGVSMIFYLPPYNPRTYEILMQREEYGPMIKKTEDYFKKFAEEQGIKIFGSYNPNGLFEQTDFCDEGHIRTISLQNFFKSKVLPEILREN